MEDKKRKAYNHRIIEIEHGTFTPLVFSSFGGMGAECLIFYNRLAECVAKKREEEVAITKRWIRTQLSFSLVKSTILCIRGSRSHKRRLHAKECK